METIVGKRSSTLAMQKHSRTITKAKPKIRIIHIFAPEIIKTDVANFRELVQRLTGKPDDSDNHHHRLLLQDHQKGPTENPREDPHHHQLHHTNINHAFFTTKKTDFENAFCANADAEEEGEEDEEEEMRTWSGGGASSGGFLSSLGDLDGFIQELGEIPNLPLAMDHASASASSSSSQFHGVFAESQQFF